MNKPPTSFPISPGTLRPIGGFPARTLGEFRALTANLPDETLLTNDDDAVIELIHDEETNALVVNTTPDL